MPPENDFDPNDKSKLPNNGQCSVLRVSSNKIDVNDNNSLKLDTSKANNNPKSFIVWRNVLVFTFLHVGALSGVYCCFHAMKSTLIFCESIFLSLFKLKIFFNLFLFLALLLYIYGGLGITAGAHRLWAHRTYKARLPLRLFLGVAQTVALQNSIYEWCRDHRAHHKHTETNAGISLL